MANESFVWIEGSVFLYFRKEWFLWLYYWISWCIPCWFWHYWTITWNVWSLENIEFHWACSWGNYVGLGITGLIMNKPSFYYFCLQLKGWNLLFGGWEKSMESSVCGYLLLETFLFICFILVFQSFT